MASTLMQLSNILLLALACVAVGRGLSVAAAPDLDAGRKHWAFQPLARVETPAMKDAAWARNDVDRFILAALEAKGLRPSPPADRRTLIRRATFDLLGLPPKPEEVEAFERECSIGNRQSAISNLVDRLLASPHYGERWARHWLDVARYADTRGYVGTDDRFFPFSYTYRDYVVRSLNEDKPYDRFVREHIAGDELVPYSADAVIATGYARLGVLDDEPDDKQMAVFDELDDVLSTTGVAFLGLTLGCARCHEHKFDPLTQKEYYGFFAFFDVVNIGYALPVIADQFDVTSSQSAIAVTVGLIGYVVGALLDSVVADASSSVAADDTVSTISPSPGTSHRIGRAVILPVAAVRWAGTAARR